MGCPESGIDEAVHRLTAKGYKVGRVEQTETAAEAKAKRGPKVGFCLMSLCSICGECMILPFRCIASSAA